MNLKEKLLTFMRSQAYKPLAPEDLAEEMGLKAKELAEFWPVLAELENSAAIIKTRFGKYGVPEHMNLIVGTLTASDKGFGFVISDNPQDRDIFIPGEAMLNAMHGDRVVARVHCREPLAGKAPEGEIIRVVRRSNTRIVGIFETSRQYGFVTADDPRIRQDIFVPKNQFNGARTGQKVVAEITKWPEKKRNAEARIVEVLGRKGEPGIEILSIIKRLNLPVAFPDEVEEAAEKVRASIDQDELAGRRDLREVVTVTMDSEDAKDLDDAVHVERLKNGRYLLGCISLMSVTTYVKTAPLTMRPGSAAQVYILPTGCCQCCQRGCPMESAV